MAVVVIVVLALCLAFYCYNKKKKESSGGNNETNSSSGKSMPTENALIDEEDVAKENQNLKDELQKHGKSVHVNPKKSPV